ncbi:MAG: hypothetical protein AVO39_11300 [delta proteobacterium MLS_D]|jgi:acyl-CoA synthetase (NDP forming)|nr:MAG: hypothetical protein AVO39_11300 [delta proteobacterium MLS_D]
MELSGSRPATIDEILHPRSVAVIGVPRELKTGKLFLTALLDQEFPGRIYPVNPSADEIDGIKAYPSVSDIPGPVDLAVILVPGRECLSVVRECAHKGVKGAVLFTAGYKELGTGDGLRLEEELVQTAGTCGMRLIGPNCMGIYAPKAGLSFSPGLSKKPGPVGIVSNSGSIANILCRIAPSRGLFFSTAVSLGNECDLSGADFLAWLGDDPDTRVIGAYLETIGDGTRLFETIRNVSLKKPIVLWKAGLTPEGRRAASSHTGAMGGSALLWRGIEKQTAVVPVNGFEAWVDTLVGFSLLPSSDGKRVAVISGPGGLAVSAAEACGREGLTLAGLSQETTRVLKAALPPTGTSIRNPVDVGMNAFLEMNIYIEASRAVAADPGVDAVFIIGTGITEESNRLFVESLITAREEFNKPFIMISIPGFDPGLIQVFIEAGFPCFETAERAIAVYASSVQYRSRRENLLKSRS